MFNNFRGEGQKWIVYKKEGVINFRTSMAMTREVSKSQILRIVKVHDDNLTCDPSYSVIDIMLVSLLPTSGFSNVDF